MRSAPFLSRGNSLSPLLLPPLPPPHLTTGRGTSTFDGNAIAYAVTKHLTTAIGCRALFATHYHTLCDDFAQDPRVALGHMVSLVEEARLLY